MEVCDRVLGDTTNGAQQSVQALIKRLAHRNANVQLYTLEVSRDSVCIRLLNYEEHADAHGLFLSDTARQRPEPKLRKAHASRALLSRFHRRPAQACK